MSTTPRMIPSGGWRAVDDSTGNSTPIVGWVIDHLGHVEPIVWSGAEAVTFTHLNEQEPDRWTLTHPSSTGAPTDEPPTTPRTPLIR